MAWGRNATPPPCHRYSWHGWLILVEARLIAPFASAKVVPALRRWLVRAFGGAVATPVTSLIANPVTPFFAALTAAARAFSGAFTRAGGTFNATAAIATTITAASATTAVAATMAAIPPPVATMPTVTAAVATTITSVTVFTARRTLGTR